MQTVILCGGKGTRMGKEDLPKVLFKLGDKPILYHIMRLYAHFGYQEFILCLGYKPGVVRDYVRGIKRWQVQCVDTGLETNTGGRIKKIEKYIRGEHFFATYGDGLADIDLKKLFSFHLQHHKLATLTAVRPCSQFGIVGIDAHTDAVTHFEEKPILDHWINGGFFVFGREIFNFLKDSDILEKQSFGRLLKGRNLAAFKHQGFWACMDTYKDNLYLNELWASGKAPWAIWRGR